MKETSFSTKSSKNEEDVISFYDEYASSWDQRFGESFSTEYFLSRRWESFENALKECDVANEQAIELGVGTGVYIEKSAVLFNKIIAIDGSSEMLKQLDKKIQSLNLNNVKCMKANVINITDIHESFADCIYFFGLIEHVVDHERFVKELARVLKTGGVVIGVTPNGKSPWYKFRKFVRGTGKHCTTDQYFNIDELNEVFLNNGFENIFTEHWGMVPAGINDHVARILSKLERLFEKSIFNKYLGGLTFAYRLNM